jgi:hypothetical protein
VTLCPIPRGESREKEEEERRKEKETQIRPNDKREKKGNPALQ